MQRKTNVNSPIVSDEKQKVRNKLLCPYQDCSKMYNKPCLLRTHILSHANIKPFVCPETDCNKRYLRLCHLLRHKASHDSKISCDSQKQEYHKNVIANSIFNEQQYTELVPNKQTSNDTTKQIKSNQMSSSLTNSGTHNNGRQNINSSIKKASDKVKNNLSNISISESSTRGNNIETTELACSRCPKYFSNIYNLKQHLPLHNETRILFACTHPGCGKAYARKSNLKVHVTTSHDGISRFHCTYPGCAKIFKFNSNLKKHNAKHINPVEQKKPRRYVRPLSSQISGYRTLLLTQDVA